MNIGEEVQEEAQPDRKEAGAREESWADIGGPDTVSDKVAADQSATEELAGEMEDEPEAGSDDDRANLRHKKRRLDPATDDFVVQPITGEGVEVPPGFFPGPIRATMTEVAGESPSLDEGADIDAKLDHIRQSLAADFEAAFAQ